MFFLKNCPSREIGSRMVFLGKNLNMSIVASIGYCIEVVGEEGHSTVRCLDQGLSVKPGTTAVPGLRDGRALGILYFHTVSLSLNNEWFSSSSSKTLYFGLQTAL